MSLKIKLTSIMVDDQDKALKFWRLKDLGVVFSMPPTQMGPVKIAVFADTCGNLIQIYPPPA